MNVSEGHLSKQYLIDYLTLFDHTEESYEQLVLQNMFLHRIGVDGGFHARVLSSILNHSEDRDLLLSLLSDCADANIQPTNLKDWLAAEYTNCATNNTANNTANDAAENAATDDTTKNNTDTNSKYDTNSKCDINLKCDINSKRKMVLSCLLRSHISETNKTAELFAESMSGVPESVWRVKSRASVIDKIKNSDMYFGSGQRPFWHAFPLDLAAATLAGAQSLSHDIIYDAVVCVAGAWFSTLSYDEMVTWLNMPRVETDEWQKIVRPLLDMRDPAPALSTADWLYTSGNYDAALDLYANITLAYAGTDAEKPAFEMMGEILSEFGDYDNAFEAYKEAFLLSRKENNYSIADGLKNLCITGDDLGEDMSEYYLRVANLANDLPVDEKIAIYFSFATSARKRRSYDNELRWIEEIIATPDCPETFFTAAMNRLSERNMYLDYAGNPDYERLSLADSEMDATLAVEKGNFAYFGFDPVGALFWYNRAATLAPSLKDKIQPKLFSAAIAAANIPDAAKYSRGIPAFEAVVHAMSPDEFALAVSSLNKAIDLSLSKSIESAAAAIYPAFLHLSKEDRKKAAEQILQSRSTRDDERARVSLAIGSVYLDLGMINSARSMLRAALRANPGSEIRSRILIELAWMEAEEGEYKQAIETYRLALKQNERFPAAWSGIAKCNIHLNNYTEALLAAEQAVSLNPASEMYRSIKEALEVVCQDKKSEPADRYFCLSGAENLAYAAALYACASNGDVSAAWDARTVADVLVYR